MFPQPKLPGYHDGLNLALLGAVPSQARCILEIGCGRGRLGAELKQQWPGRRVIGIELDEAAAQIALQHLDEVSLADIETAPPDFGPNSFDCIILGDVLEHLNNPEAVLHYLRPLLRDDGSLAICGPNFAHHSVVKALLRDDLMYQPDGLLDHSHLRFFTYATYVKLLLDSGFLPRIREMIKSGGIDHLMPAATPLLQYYGVDPSRALRQLDVYQYIFEATKLADAPGSFGSNPITFIVCVNDDDQLHSNLLRSPCLGPGSPHQVIQMRDQASAADGFHRALKGAEHSLIVCVQQDIYLPRGWDAWFTRGFEAAEERFGSVGLAGVFGLQIDGDEVHHFGRVIDRETLLNRRSDFPCLADSLDEIILAFRRDSPARFDPSLGFHLYGLDACLTLRQAGRVNVIIDAPCFHNSLFAHLSPEFHSAREQILRKWGRRLLFSNMGRLDTMEGLCTPPADASSHEAPVVDPVELEELRAKVARLERHLANIEATTTWRLRTRVNRMIGRL